ncbi:hypothetical protein Ocin01_12543, partial [Orchesella cincta]
NSVNPSQLEPAGEDKNGILYVARTEVNGEWVPGKGYYRGRTFYASVAFMGKEIESADCSVLLRGGTKWIAQQKNREIPTMQFLLVMIQELTKKLTFAEDLPLRKDGRG